VPLGARIPAVRGRPRRYLALVIAAGLGIAAHGVLSVTTLRTERTERESRSYDAALWRLDLAVIALLSLEQARPPEQFRPARVTEDTERPPPLLEPPGEVFKLYFEWSPSQGYVSPSFPDADSMNLAISRGWTRGEKQRETSRLLMQLDEWQPEDSLETLINQPGPPGSTPIGEFQRRVTAVHAARQRAAARSRSASISGSQPQPFKPYFVRGLPDGELEFELFFLRPTQFDGQGRVPDEARIQGLWVDWPRFEDSLRRELDQIPGAADSQLVPLAMRPEAPESRWLASLPMTLELPTVGGWPDWTPTRRMLVISWMALLSSLAAALFALRAAWELSERRGRFVSSVTHELRTPLTTFNLYTEMLAGGLIREEDKRQEYMETLRDEAQRLSRVVENVLLYARVEGRRTGIEAEVLSAQELVEEQQVLLERRAREAGVRLEVHGLEDLNRDQRVRADASAVGQILGNLVDNAAKYALRGALAEPDSPAGVVELHVKHDRNWLTLIVGDRGPGVPDADRDRIFEPFERAAGDRAGEIPGVGLGLALSRGLAQALGGELELVEGPASGANFALRLRRA
jgi:signal transduction histidine kinase